MANPPLCQRACPTFQMRREVCEADPCATVGFKCHSYGAANTTTDCFSWCCVKDDNMIAVVAIIITVIVLVFIGCVVFVICFCCRKKKEKRRGTLNRENLVQKQMELEENGSEDPSSDGGGGFLGGGCNRPDSVSELIDKDDSKAMSLSMATPNPEPLKPGQRGNAWGDSGTNHPKAPMYEEAIQPYDIPEVIVERPIEDQSLNGSRQQPHSLNTSTMPVSARSNVSQQQPTKPAGGRGKTPAAAVSPPPQQKPIKKRDEELFAVPDLVVQVSPGPYDLEPSSSNASPQALSLEPAAPAPHRPGSGGPRIFNPNTHMASTTSPAASTPTPTNLNNNNRAPIPQVYQQQQQAARNVSPPHQDEMYFNDDDDHYGGHEDYSPQQQYQQEEPQRNTYGGGGSSYKPEFNFDDDDDFFN